MKESRYLINLTIEECQEYLTKSPDFPPIEVIKRIKSANNDNEILEIIKEVTNNVEQQEKWAQRFIKKKTELILDSDSDDDDDVNATTPEERESISNSKRRGVYLHNNQ